MRDHFADHSEKQKLAHAKEILACRNKSEKDKQEIEMLTLYKVKCGELEDQVENMAKMLQFQKGNVEEQKRSVRSLEYQVQTMKNIIREQGERLNG